MRKCISILLVALIIVACGTSDDNNGDQTGTDNYNRSELLENMADNIIIPSYEDFQVKLTTLQTTITAFTAAPSQSALEQLRIDWLTAYGAWQHVELFNIGKAEELQYTFYMNVYPANETDINTAISTGNYDLNSANFHDAQGFPAIDYLIHGIGNSDAEIISKYTGENAINYKKYLNAISTQMIDLTKQVVSHWENGYRDSFVTNTASSATGAISKMANDFIYYYEKGFRANKLGIPAGVFSNGTVYPQYVEGYYQNDVSKQLALEAFKTVVNFYNGKAFGTNIKGESFKSYLEALDREDIQSSITEKLKAAENAINTLDISFSNQVKTDNEKMTLAYDVIQKVIPLLKVDMAQAFNVRIDYVDADGD